MANRDIQVYGWREWLSLPDLNVAAIKAKLDTGARTSSLHAFRIRRFDRDGVDMVSFEIHPVQRSRNPVIAAEAVVIDERSVRSSGGHAEVRPVIRSTLELGGERWPIELTLTRRDQMGFRMLLGRQALRGRGLVDPGSSFTTGRMQRRRKRAAGKSTEEVKSKKSKKSVTQPSARKAPKAQEEE